MRARAEDVLEDIRERDDAEEEAALVRDEETVDLVRLELGDDLMDSVHVAAGDHTAWLLTGNSTSDEACANNNHGTIRRTV